jgi:aminoglycoside phosphotransferase (APT) family kinase protein
VDRQIDTILAATGLPGFGAALDLRTIGPVLSAVTSVSGVSGADASVGSAEVIDLKFPKRALIAYGLESSDGAWVLLGKHFADLAHARRVHETLAALFELTNKPSSRWGVPRPLGWLLERGLVLYVAVWGRFLDEDIEVNSASCMARAAECLAELHMSDLALDRRLDLATECDSVALWANVIASTQPDLAPQAERLAAELIRLSHVIDFERDVPIHKDVHYRHMVVGPKLVLLDFDEMHFGDSSFDVAHFCAPLHLLALRRGMSPEGLEQAFLDGYSRHRAWTPDERFRFFFAYTWLKLASLLCLQERVAPRPVGAERHRQTAALLTLGAARLESPAGAISTSEAAGESR